MLCSLYTRGNRKKWKRERERERIFFLKREKIDCLKQATSNVMATCIFSSMNTIGKYRKYREIEGGNKNNTVSHDYFSILVNILVYITVFLYPCINRYNWNNTACINTNRYWYKSLILSNSWPAHQFYVTVPCHIGGSSSEETHQCHPANSPTTRRVWESALDPAQC